MANNNIAAYNAQRKAEAEAKAQTEGKAPTKAELERQSSAQLKINESLRKKLAEKLANEPKVRVIGSPMYRPWFGENMLIAINGVEIYLPLDGQAYEIPESYALEFQSRIELVDEEIRIRNAMSNIEKNSETYAGEKELIRRV
jgi:hypothetical protein